MGPISFRLGGKKPYSEYRNEGACNARPKIKKIFLKIFYKNKKANVCFHPKQPFTSAENQQNDSLLSANSRQK
jgi:hypothetical protein